MNVLIYGSNGWIGSMMCRLLEKEKIPFVKAKSRACQLGEVEDEILKENPTHVMSFIGRTHGKIDDKYYPTIDYLEQKGKLRENVRDNLYSPVGLAILCNKYNIHFTYLGTGCIFTYDELHLCGNKTTGFKEDDDPNFFGSSYSIVKGYTDQMMRFVNCLNLRIRMPITDKLDARNFITKIISYEKICSIPNSMSVLDDLLPIALDMAKNKKIGTYNFTNPGVISHNEILHMYKNIIDPNFTWKNFSQQDQLKVLDADRSNNFLDTTKIEELYPSLQHIEKSIYDVFQRMKS